MIQKNKANLLNQAHYPYKMRSIKILPGIKIIDLALKIDNNLIISDTHIGYEEAINKHGILIPRFQFKDITERLERIFHNCKEPIETFIINGDVKHEFSTISETEWRNTLALLDFVGKKCRRIVIVKGNHDTVIGPIAEKRNVKIVRQHIIKSGTENILLLHGHILPKKMPNCNVIIIGHQHPAITLRDGLRSELYKCFLRGKYKKAWLIVIPAFTPVSTGTDVLREVISPFLEQDIDDFYVYPVEDSVYEFGKVSDLRSV